MKRRYLYLLVFAVPAFIAAAITAVLLFGAFAGALWLFVYGDNSWPATIDTALVTILMLVFLTLWAGLLALAYRAGKRQESCTTLNTRHLALSAGATLFLLLLVVLHQFGVGNLGTPSNGVLCARFCSASGFAGSGMPPADSGATTCSCFDTQGRVARMVPIDSLSAKQR